MAVATRRLRHDPVEPLLARADSALAWAVGTDLLEQPLEPQVLWSLPFVEKAVRDQLRDGSWRYGSDAPSPHEDYAQLATYKQLLVLVSIYRLDRRHPTLERAAEFLLRHQTREGDVRGIYGAQYTPNYTADIVRLLIEAGYAKDQRIATAIDWLLSVRQSDGGWAIPARTRGDVTLSRTLAMSRPIERDPARPSSHFVTGIVLRALTAHPHHRHSRAAIKAAQLLTSRFFMPDHYPDHRAADHWTALAFPFRWTDIVSALDSVALAGLPPSEEHISSALDWLVAHQYADGLWRSGYRHNPNPLNDEWVSFAAARTFKRIIGTL